MTRFADRRDAGRRLTAMLRPLAAADVVVLGLPRGGVPVAYEVAKGIGAPLDVLLVRKLGAPHHRELAMGAIGEDGVRVLNDGLLYRLGVRAAFVAEVERRERAELKRRASCYRGDRPAVPLAGKVALVVDDGIATGATARAACAVVAQRGADRVVLATPVLRISAASEASTATSVRRRTTKSSPCSAVADAQDMHRLAAGSVEKSRVAVEKQELSVGDTPVILKSRKSLWQRGCAIR
jgi:predicted phosphoribosyltransferase